jgi:hypothetical protein
MLQACSNTELLNNMIIIHSSYANVLLDITYPMKKKNKKALEKKIRKALRESLETNILNAARESLLQSGLQDQADRKSFTRKARKLARQLAEAARISKKAAEAFSGTSAELSIVNNADHTPQPVVPATEPDDAGQQPQEVMPVSPDHPQS